MLGPRATSSPTSPGEHDAPVVVEHADLDVRDWPADRSSLRGEVLRRPGRSVAPRLRWRRTSRRSRPSDRAAATRRSWPAAWRPRPASRSAGAAARPRRGFDRCSISAKVDGTPANPVTACSAMPSSTTIGERDAVLDHDRAADRQMRVQQRQAVDVVERQHAHDAVGSGQPQVVDDRPCVGHQIAVREHHAARLARASPTCR